MKCSVENCKKILTARNRTGMCIKHYQSWYIRNKWRNNKEYRIAQTKRVMAWILKNKKRWKEINNKAANKYWSKTKV